METFDKALARQDLQEYNNERLRAWLLTAR